jgi:O-antigen ligase
MSHASRPHRADDNLKYAPGVAPRAPTDRPLSILERITFAHVAILLVGTTWAFGGQAAWVRTPIAWWSSLGALLTLTAVQDREAWRQGWIRPLVWVWPMVAFNALVLLACLNPSFREIKFGAETLYAHNGGRAGFPSSARPDAALRALWLFDALWISCFNVALVLRQRRTVRALLIIAAANAALLAVFGTAQKLTHAKGIYFDAVATPQIYFFASFVYHNHWGAFMLLMMATTLALIWHYARRRGARNFFHTPAFGGVVLLLVLAATVPLSGSRSSTLLAIGLLGAAFLHWLVQLVRTRRRFRESIALPVIGAVGAMALGLGAIWFVARDTIMARIGKTQEQVAEMRAQGTIGDRAQLYGNTWRMAKDKLWFGWGMGSYPHVFTPLYNTRRPRDKIPIFYNDAHSDWLQSFAEHGLIGSALLALNALVPLARLRRRHFTSPLPAYLLGGCLLVLVYALVEFPLGNVGVVLCWWLCFFCAVHYARLQDREFAANDQPPVASPPSPA